MEAYESGEPPYDLRRDRFRLLQRRPLCRRGPRYNCRDPEVGTVAEWAQKIIDSFADSYVEASPSGTGVHIIFEGTLKDGAKKKKQSTGIEAYGQDRYRETGDDDNKNEARAEDRENKRAQSTEPALQGGLSQKKVREVLGEPAYYQGPARALAEYREDPSAENLARLTRSIRFSLGICPRRRGGSARSGWSGPSARVAAFSRRRDPEVLADLPGELVGDLRVSRDR